MRSGRNRFYLFYTLLLMIVLPILSILAELLLVKNTPAVWKLVGQWFLFWAVGVRLFTAGLNQIARPSFTLQSIFHINNLESGIIVRELGISNVGTGIGGIVSLLLVSWRVPIAFIAAVFLGAAALQHAIKKPVSENQWIALFTDALIFLVLVGFLILSFVE